jgi:haloacetate dehalogenase
MSDYLAGKEDVAQDEEDVDQKITCPTLALWGEEFAIVGKMYDVAAIWKEMCSNLQTISIPNCGHLPHEECPDVVNDALMAFLKPLSDKQSRDKNVVWSNSTQT